MQDITVTRVNSGNAFNDVERSELLAPYFTKKHWPGKGISWEFIVPLTPYTGNARLDN
jgi:hypothetical protein